MTLCELCEVKPATKTGLCTEDNRTHVIRRTGNVTEILPKPTFNSFLASCAADCVEGR